MAISFKTGKGHPSQICIIVLMANQLPPFVDWLRLAEVPTHRNLFFLGVADRRITLYSQQVRALRLVHALSSSGRLLDNPRVAVVGAGAAGVTAALAFASLQIRVDLIDQSHDILQLQSHSGRLLHPHIYDWPRPGSLRSEAVLPFLDWSRASGGDVCAEMRPTFHAACHRYSKLCFRRDTRLSALKEDSNEWELVLKKGAEEKAEAYDIVVLAMGFGDEQALGDAPPINYWKAPGVGTPATEVNSSSYLLSGNGDGGLADAMALIIEDFEHLSFTQDFLGLLKGPELANAVMSISQDTSIDVDLEPVFQETVLPLLKRRGIIDHIAGMLRADRSITFNCAGALFASGRAALLNQIIAFSVFEAAREIGRPVYRTRGKVTAVEKREGAYIVTGPHAEGVAVAGPFDQIILRHGPDRAERYRPCFPYYDAYVAYAETLRKIEPLLFAPPELDPQTFLFFEQLFGEKLVDHQLKDAASALRFRRDNTLLLSWDGAAQIAVQQGSMSLADLAQLCETLSEPATIHLALPRDKLRPHGDVLIRLAKASSGLIRLEVDLAVAATWQASQQAMPSMTSFSSPYRVGQIPAVDLLWDALDVSLVRQLEAKLTEVCSTGFCPTIGHVHESIVSTLGTIWTRWRTALFGDRELRRDFLGLLVNIDHAGSSGWDGDTACLPHLVAALVLMLATHAGEALQPGRCAPGNLNFRNDAIGLGSGCQFISGVPISDRLDPDAWNVDALILSGAQTAMFVPGGLIGDGGTAPSTFISSSRIAPAVIQSSPVWRSRLNAGLAEWSRAVGLEFDGWKQRQDVQLKGS